MRWGTYARASPPHTVQRYRCSHCRRRFSDQTFSTTYWLKRPHLVPVVYDGLVNCVCLRQLARVHQVSHATIQKHVERISRHCLLFLQRHRPRQPPSEPLVVDGFESFHFSQYHPLHLHVAVGARTHFLYAFTASELRRKGRMTAFQKQKREQLEETLGRPDPKAIEKDVAELVGMLAPKGERLTIRSDEHPAYPRAFRRSGFEVTHEPTSSQAARTTGNPLFPVNRLDGLTRHSSANHKRETIAYSKRLGGALERFAALAVWFNFQKSCAEKQRGSATPAQTLGVRASRLTTHELFRERLFVARIGLPDAWQRAYERRMRTRALPREPVHACKYAF